MLGVGVGNYSCRGKNASGLRGAEGCKVRTKYDIIMISVYVDINMLCPRIPELGEPSVMSVINFLRASRVLSL